MTTTPILERDEWGMRIADGKSLHVHRGMPVGEVYVHQTAGRDPVEEFPSGDDDPRDAFRALNEWAITGKGYTAVDYSALVHTGPSLRTTIGKARWEYVPAATLDRNTESKAVCLLGWFGPPDPRYPWTFEHSRAPFRQELEAIAETIVLMIREGLVRPDAKILGHRDNPEHPNATACPGEYLYAELPWIRRRVAELLAGNTVHTIPGGTMLHTADPHARLLDTRSTRGPVRPGEVISVEIPTIAGADDPKTAVFAVTVVNPDRPGHIQVAGSVFGAAGGGNFAPGGPPAFSSWMAPIVNGRIQVRVSAGAHLIVDLMGVVD